MLFRTTHPSFYMCLFSHIIPALTAHKSQTPKKKSPLNSLQKKVDSNNFIQDQGKALFLFTSINNSINMNR